MARSQASSKLCATASRKVSSAPGSAAGGQPQPLWWHCSMPMWSSMWAGRNQSLPASRKTGNGSSRRLSITSNMTTLR
ncbi:hypothetical protein A6R68_07506 [Neotoma lepida]|uniref:Uncharacterized protein n=1 Tax=Neotoma lepida TaxID=56216 RepID=A0A1A6GDX2_NEOLE|nr:hypothetical protein A6R68_07506 [Neotoma lepida]